MKTQITKDPFISRYSCIVEENINPGLRVDRYFAENLAILSRSQVKTRKLKVRLNGKEVKISKPLKGGEKLDFFWEDAESLDLIPEDLPLQIIYEDPRVVVVNKAQGMVVHPGAGNPRGTLANALCYRRNILNLMHDKNIRPGIVHRLDKDTSGLIICAWDEEAHTFLSKQFYNRKVIKTYAAIVQGCPKEKKGRIDMPIRRNRRNRKLFSVDSLGKSSLTLFQVVKSWGSHSLLLLRPRTGRTHQLRVHLKFMGNPILGDPLYGSSDSRFPGQTLMLHSKRLTLILPGGISPGIPNDISKSRTFRTSFPERFYNLFSSLNSL